MENEDSIRVEDLDEEEDYRGGKSKDKKPVMIANPLGPSFSKIEKPDPTKGQTVGRTPWEELNAANHGIFEFAGKYHGPGKYDPATHQYFEFAYKGARFRVIAVPSVRPHTKQEKQNIIFQDVKHILQTVFGLFFESFADCFGLFLDSFGLFLD